MCDTQGEASPLLACPHRHPLCWHPSFPAPLFASTPSLPAKPLPAPGSRDRRGVPPSACVWWGWGQLPGGWHCPGAHPQGKQLRALQPYVLSCCYSADGSVVAKTFQVLRDLVDQLPWQHSAAFLIQLAFTLPPFLEEESEHLRLTAFEIYGALLAKVSRRVFVFPLRHQVLNLLILLVLHLEDANSRIAQISRPTLCHLATLLGWSKLRATFAEKDVWTILSALLQQEAGRALWFLKQSVLLFRSPQVPIRRTAVWFAGQILQTLGAEEAREMDEVHAGGCGRPASEPTARQMSLRRQRPWPGF
ncbi:PREDICTED: maestro heat-like repeat family member 5 isoform X2 [Capra hircus]|uniref:maestro heat-like repeat family member 5 isoform X2 n=1 Tax=Capra hircus TaxID=9925 RepID=UPI000847B21F|nr:PREDICTED: maestro heat-like repeat family member 5 isoform X2 [Capra hircus]